MQIAKPLGCSGDFKESGPTVKSWGARRNCLGGGTVVSNILRKRRFLFWLWVIPAAAAEAVRMWEAFFALPSA